MVDVLRKAISEAVFTEFGFPIYIEKTGDSGSEACFVLEVASTKETPLLGRRRERRITFSLRYFPEVGKVSARREQLEVMDRLYGALFLIGKEEKFIGSEMQHSESGGQFLFSVCYSFHLVAEEKEETMQRLEHNGRKVIGFGEWEI